MATLRERLTPLRIAASPTPDLSAWIAAWPEVRSKFEALIEEYERRNPSFHRQWAESALDSSDDALRALGHRMVWLQRRLVSIEDEPDKIQG